mmetsp:Transcript_11041/g.15233  ORF Transcript_11041/g.15233 Transcript_11041/m.15233 type:complete len:183 (-) Transcript_11041:3-551(-)
MNSLLFKRAKSFILRLDNAALSTNVLSKHLSPNASAPLIQAYRPLWPDPEYFRGSVIESSTESLPAVNLPPRTIPDSALRFTFKTTFQPGSAISYTHLRINPADFKVSLKVSLSHLNLNDDERLIFIRMVAARFNQGRNEVKLVSNRFPNRLENKKYLIYMLESLLLETRRLYSEKSNYEEK